MGLTSSRPLYFYQKDIIDCLYMYDTYDICKLIY